MPIKALSQEQLNHNIRLFKIDSENFQGNIEIIMRLTNTYLDRLIHVLLWYAKDPRIKEIAKSGSRRGHYRFLQEV